MLFFDFWNSLQKGLRRAKLVHKKHLPFSSLFCKTLNTLNGLKIDMKLKQEMEQGDDSMTDFMFVSDGFEHIIRCSLTSCQKSLGDDVVSFYIRL